MTKIYSFVEVAGKTLNPPAARPPRFDSVIYLAEIDQRHYVAVKEPLPPQPPEIELQGPLDLKQPAHQAVAQALRQRAEPLRRMRTERALAYPLIGDQLDALMKELQRRREAGDKLAPELEAVLDQIASVKQRYPKDDLGLD